jgi:hypothetical protein
MRKIKFMMDVMEKGVLYKAGQIVPLNDKDAERITRVQDKKSGERVALDSKEAAKVLKEQAEKKKAELDAQLKELENEDSDDEDSDDEDSDDEEDDDFVGEPAVEVEDETPRKPKRRGRKKG